MSKNDPIMQRMKANYEVRSRTYLTRRTPVIMRLDGKCFSQWTKGLDKPFDDGLIEDMAETAKFLCSEIQGAKCAYVQSDEISILITDFDKLETSAWFDYSVQKMVSVSASLATAMFNKLRQRREYDKSYGTHNPYSDYKLAFFDSRVFNIPKEEVPNYFHARQRDAVKNSVSMLAQSLYSHTELHKKNGSEMQEMCFQKGHNWNNLHYSKKRGNFIVKNMYINGNIVLQENLVDRTNPLEGEMWYQPDNKDGIYPSKNGRALEWAENTAGSMDWCDVEIQTIRSKWECIETPMKLNDRKIFEQWIKEQ